MGIGGRRPTTIEPTLTGHHPQPDPSAAGGTIVALEAPEELSAEGRGIWDIITPELIKGRVLRPDDVPMLVEACEAWALTRKFRQQLWQAVRAYDALAGAEPGPDSTPEDHEVWVAQLDMASAIVKRTRSAWTASYKAASSAAGDLGLGPTNRVRLGLAQVQGASLLDALTNGTGVPEHKDGE